MSDLRKLQTSRIPIIWVLGGPGPGKGTQCARLVEKYGFVHLSIGDLLRDEVRSGSEKGKEINEMMENDLVISRQLVLDLLKQAILTTSDTARKGYLIDGLISTLIKFEEDIAPCSLVLFFDCKEETMKQRLLGRSASSGRADDNEATFVKRLENFHNKCKPVIARFNDKVVNICAARDIDTIFAQCMISIEKTLTT